MEDLLEHRNGQDCLVCGDGATGVRCCHSGYSRRYLRFVEAHREAFDALYLDGNPAAARNEQERLRTEFKTLPPRHDCSCWPTHCGECARLARQRIGVCASCLKLPLLQRPRPGKCIECNKLDDSGGTTEIGRTSPVNPPMPLTLLLDMNAGYAA